jgi:hypothetical protein
MSYTMGRGESRTFTITVTSAAGALVDLTGAEVYFVVRDLAGDVVLTKLSTAAGGSDDEIEIPDQAADSGALEGQCYLKLTTTDTDLAQAARWADCWVVTAGSPPEQLKVDVHAPFYVTGAEPPTFA